MIFTTLQLTPSSYTEYSFRTVQLNLQIKKLLGFKGSVVITLPTSNFLSNSKDKAREVQNDMH